MIKDILDWVDQFAREQGIMALIAVGALLFLGTVVWGMDRTLQEHVQDDPESIRLLRVICESVAKDDPWRRACVDASYDANKLGDRNPDNHLSGEMP
jgi:hypothetical protein